MKARLAGKSLESDAARYFFLQLLMITCYLGKSQLALKELYQARLRDRCKFHHSAISEYLIRIMREGLSNNISFNSPSGATRTETSNFMRLSLGREALQRELLSLLEKKIQLYKKLINEQFQNLRDL